MSVQTANARSGPFTCNASNTVFPGGFKIFDKDGVLVSLTDTLGNISELVVDSDYTVSAITETSFTVTTVVTYPADYLITLTRDIEQTQETTFRSQGKRLAENTEDALDKSMMALQAQTEVLNRAVKVPVSSSLDPDDILQDLLDGHLTAVAYTSEKLLSSYSSLYAAVLGIGSSEVNLVIDKDDTLAQNTVIPANITLRVVEGNVIDLNGFFLSLYCNIDAANVSFILINGGDLSSTIGASVVYPEWFSAVGNGAIDDTVAVKASLSFNDTTVVMNRDYRVTSEVEIGGNNVGVMGSGSIVLDASSGSALYADDKDGITIKDIRITPPTARATNVGDAGIELDGCTNSRVQDVRIEYRGNTSPEGNGVVLHNGCRDCVVIGVIVSGGNYNADSTSNTQANSPTGISVWNDAERIAISDCIVSDGIGDAFVVQYDSSAGAVFVKDVRVNNCIADGSHGHMFIGYSDDIHITTGTARIINLDFSNCTAINGTGKKYNSTLVKRIYGIGFYLQSVLHGRVVNCRVKDCLQNTVTSGNPIPSAGISATIADAFISGCEVDNTGITPGIKINATNPPAFTEGTVQILNNTIRNITTEEAISVGQAETAQIEGNLISNCGGVGVRVEAPLASGESQWVQTATVRNNIIVGNVGIAVDVDDCKNLYLSGNVIKNPTGRPIDINDCEFFKVEGNTIDDWGFAGVGLYATHGTSATPNASSSVRNNTVKGDGTQNGMSIVGVAWVDTNLFENVAVPYTYSGTPENGDGADGRQRDSRCRRSEVYHGRHQLQQHLSHRLFEWRTRAGIDYLV